MQRAVQSYIVGFLLAVALTLIAYLIVVNRFFPSPVATAVIIGLAITQLLVQLIFFLHLGQESKPRWQLVFFISTVGIILIVVIGSLWIMANLNYHMMRSPAAIDQYVQDQEGGF